MCVFSSFIPPLSTKENAHQWYKQGYDIVDGIVHTRQELLGELKQSIQNDIDVLAKEWQTIRVGSFNSSSIYSSISSIGKSITNTSL